MMKNKEKNFISAVIYVNNADDRIEEFIKNVICLLEENFEHSEIICVNDCSTDKSLEKIKKTCTNTKTTNVSILNLSYFHGLELAMNAGVDLAIGDFVFEFDFTFLDYDINYIIKIYQRALEGFDIVSASPNKKKKLSSKIFYYVFDKFTNVSTKLNTESFRIISRRAINRISSINESVPYRKVIYTNCGLKTDNILYELKSNISNKTTIKKREKDYRRRLAVDTLILFTDVGYRFAITMTVLMLFSICIVAAYSLITYIISSPIVGWTTTILFLSFCFFGLFGILTIIIKYLQIIIDLIFKRKRYRYESIEKITN